MRITLVIYDSLEARSGGYIYDIQVVSYLRAHGVQVDILSLSAGSRLPLRLQQGVQELWRLLRPPADSPGCDAVVIDELTHRSVYRLLVRRRVSAPSVLTLVHHLTCSEPLPLRARRAAQRIETALLRHSQAAVVNSQVTARSVRQLAGESLPVYVCPPGSDLLPELGHGEASDRGRRRGRPRLPGDPPRLLVTGNLIWRKGLDLLFEALGGLLDLSWQLRVVGPPADPGYYRRLRRLEERLGLAGRIRYTGELSGSALAEEYLSAQLFVFPSRYEGYGISLAEALRAGLPFVAFATGAVREITGGRGGYLVRPGDVPGFRRALRGLIARPERREALARLAREAAATLPGWEDTGRGFLEALRRELGQD